MKTTTENYFTSTLNYDNFLIGLGIDSPSQLYNDETSRQNYIDRIKTQTNKQIHNLLHKINIELKAEQIQIIREQNEVKKINLDTIQIKIYSVEKNNGFHWQDYANKYKNIRVVDCNDGSTCWDERKGIEQIAREFSIFGVLLFDKTTNSLLARCWLKWINKKSFILFNCYSNFECDLKTIANTFNINNNKIGLINSQDTDNYFYVNNGKCIIVNNIENILSYDLDIDVSEYKPNETFTDCHNNEIDIDEQDNYTYSDYLDSYILNDDLLIAYDKRGNEVYLCNCCDNDITRCNHCEEYNLND